MSRPIVIAAALALVAGMASCGDGGTTAGPDGSITVFAAASLTDAFEDLASRFEVDHPGVDVVVNFAGTSALREQILEGAPADVFASADVADMDALVEAGAVADPRVFATNSLAIAIPLDNPGNVTGLGDLTRAELLVGLCAATVPCGRAAREVLDRAGVAASVDTEEPDVRAVLTKVEAGELDVGLVYVSDVVSTDKVGRFDISSEVNVTVRYPIATVDDARNADAAQRFVDFVLSDAGLSVVLEHGFGAP